MTRDLRVIGGAEEREKFQCIYQQYYGLLYRVAYGILHHKEDAEEAVQETLIRIVQNLSKISDPYCPETKNFLVIICKNVSLTLLKKRKRVKVEELSDLLPDERLETNPEEVNRVSETIQLVADAILELPERYRDCMYLELIQELDCWQIAQALGRKPETVRKQLQRGKKILREMLKERGVTYEA